MKNKVLLILIILFVFLGVLGLWFWQRNTYSKEALKLEIIAPSSIDLGGEIEYLVKFKNNGDINLEEPRLVFEFPSYSLPTEGDSLRRTIEGDEIGLAVYPGQGKVFKFKARLFGQKGETREAKASLYYRPKNLTAKYFSKTSHITTISSVPISFEFDLPSEAQAGRRSEFSLNYFSSVDFALEDVAIKAEYPSGFSFIESDPKGLARNEWQIYSLDKAGGGRINIAGILSGETGETKMFKAELGIWVGGNYVILKKTTKRVEIIEPSIYIDQTINGSHDYIANPGDLLHYQIIFRNIGDRPFQNLFLVAKLKGELLDFSTLKAENGEYALGDNSIIWDGDDISPLKFLEAGQQGEIEFWINLKDDDSVRITNPKIENEIRLSQTKRKFVVKVNSKVESAQSAFIDDEFFGSQGPIPPSVGQESQITAVWRIKNYYNQLKDVKVRATLPAEVQLTGQIQPQKLTFDSTTREMLWEIGELPAGAGLDEPLQIAFQVILKPTADQKDKLAILINEVKISGVDEWTDNEISISIPAMDTSVFGEGTVVQ